jgi:hypothetical protein
MGCFHPFLFGVVDVKTTTVAAKTITVKLMDRFNPSYNPHKPPAELLPLLIPVETLPES